jgi:hypothetical protein
VQRKILLWLGALSSVGFLYVALRDIALDQFITAFEHSDILPVLAAFAIMLLVYWVRTLRWQAIIESSTPISRGQTFSALMIGFFGNNVLPARAGELLRAVVLRRQLGLSRSFVLGTIVVERVMDVAALIALLLLTLSSISRNHLPPIAADVRALSIALLGVVSAAMFLLLWGRARVVIFLERILGRVVSVPRGKRIAGRFKEFSSGLEILRDPKRFAYVAFLSLGSWLGMVGVFYLVFVAFHFDLPAAAAGLTVALVNLGMAVPSSPGYVGTYEFFMVKSLNAFGIGKGAALAYGLVTRLLWYVFEIVVGFLLLWRTELPLRELLKSSEEDTPPAD